MWNKLKEFCQQSSENRTQVWLLFTFLVLPIIAMLVLLVYIFTVEL